MTSWSSCSSTWNCSADIGWNINKTAGCGRSGGGGGGLQRRGGGKRLQEYDKQYDNPSCCKMIDGQLETWQTPIKEKLSFYLYELLLLTGHSFNFCECVTILTIFRRFSLSNIILKSAPRPSMQSYTWPVTKSNPISSSLQLCTASSIINEQNGSLCVCVSVCASVCLCRQKRQHLRTSLPLVNLPLPLSWHTHTHTHTQTPTNTLTASHMYTCTNKQEFN